MTPWLDYLDARRRLIHEWHALELDAVDIAFRFSVDREHVLRILQQRLDPPAPGTSRSLVAQLRQRVRDLERAIHQRDFQPARALPPRSDIRSLLSNPDPALCGCQFWLQTDGMTVQDSHHPECIFAPKRQG